MMLLEMSKQEALIGLAICALALLIFAALYAIWQRFCNRRSPAVNVADGVTEPLIPETLSTTGSLRRPSDQKDEEQGAVDSEESSSYQFLHWQADVITEPLIPENLSTTGSLRRPSDQKDEELGVVDSEESSAYPSSIVQIDPHCLQEEPEKVFPQCSTLILEVISGPSRGTRISKHATCSSDLSLRIGRLSHNDVVLNDPEVSGRHAAVYWNKKDFQWELVDLGSLNGTLLNSNLISNQDSTQRQRGLQVQLSNADVITLGSTSQVFVQISDQNISRVADVSMHFSAIGVGIVSEPMTIRRGGKHLPMEDVFFYEMPLRNIQQFGVFCIFDGHGGAEAAKAASKIMPEMLAGTLLNPERRERAIYNSDAADVLREAFKETEAALQHEYQGCTATVLLLWYDYKNRYFAQCANVGDSACIFNIGGRNVIMTEDHRLTSSSEKARMLEIGKKLREGENRLCGMNIARVLGDKFLKEQDIRFSADPYISAVLQISPSNKSLGIIASDGLWDVLSPTGAMQLAVKVRDGEYAAEEVHTPCAQRIANFIVNEARKLRTKDNTTVMVLDFTNINEYFRLSETKKMDSAFIHTGHIASM